MKTLRSLIYGNALIALLGCASAHASIIYAFVSETPVAGGFDWKYTAQLSADQQLLGTATDFAVIYDFPGVISATSTSLIGGVTTATSLELVTTPQPNSQSVPDNASMLNVRTNITGTFSSSTATNIYTVDVISSLNTQGPLLNQSAQAIKNAPGDPANGTITGNTARIIGPGTPTPEPATMALFGSALLSLGFIRRRKA